MNYVKFLVALAAMCVLIIPAFSMPDNGMGRDASQMWQGQDGKQMFRVKITPRRPAAARSP